MQTIDRPWSYSSLTLYEKCPHAYKLRYLDKCKEPPNPAMERGTAIHTEIEGYLLGQSELSDETHKLKAYYTGLKHLQPVIEEPWGFDINWQPTSWNNAWCRMKLDAYVPGKFFQICDHKTGKYYPVKAIDQGQLYAVGASIRFPGSDKFEVTFAYVDSGELKSTTYPKSKIAKIQQRFTERASKLNIDRKFEPKPHKFTCKYCSLFEYCDYGVTE
jgi:CRISPR/Cas system-associated exonuclease Cas4 (RecB family)